MWPQVMSEITLKWLEMVQVRALDAGGHVLYSCGRLCGALWRQTGLPMTTLSAFVGPLKLSTGETRHRELRPPPLL